MVLSGTLQEFILADIFQILAQQKATGRLVLKCEQKTGQAILLNGIIIAADEENENFQAKLANFLLTVRGIPERDVDDLLGKSGSTIVSMAQQILVRKYMTLTEVVGIAQATLEDFTCSLFAWTSGNYQFESLENVAGWHLGGVSLSSDFIIMEAMRKIDESKKIHARITDDTVFVATGNSEPAPAASADTPALLAKPDQYIFSFIDGLSSVAVISQKTFISKSRVYETLYRLWEDDCIASLPPKLSRSIKAAIDKHPHEYQTVGPAYMALISVLLTCSVLLVVGGMFVLQSALFSKEIKAANRLKSELRISRNLNKTATAEIQYRARFGVAAQTIEDLVKAGYIDRRDAARTSRLQH